MRRDALRRQIEAKVGKELERRLVRAQLVAKIAAAEDAKRARAERPLAPPSPPGQCCCSFRVCTTTAGEARPAARRVPARDQHHGRQLRP